jgi:hypothetical protein
MFPDDMIANKWPLENRSMFFGSLSLFGIHPYLMESIKRKIYIGPLDNETITTLSVFYLNL